MDEQVQEQEPAAEGAPSAEAPPPEAPAPVPPPPPEPEVKPTFLSRVNPLKLFRKETAATYVREGEDLVENHNLAQATMAFQKAVTLDPDFVPAYKGLGSALLRKGGRSNLATALENYQEAITRDPFDDQAYAVSAKIHEKLGQLKEATLARKKMVIVKTLQADPSNPVANNNMGILMLQQQQVDTAVAHFKKSIAANPSYDVAFRNLAATYYRIASAEQDEDKKNELVGQARSYISRALEISKTVVTMLIQGKILLLEGKFEEALEVAAETEELEQANKDVYALKRQALEGLNRTAEAQEAYESYKIFSRH
jgi:superkiller protein 3